MELEVSVRAEAPWDRGESQPQGAWQAGMRRLGDAALLYGRSPSSRTSDSAALRHFMSRPYS